nr:unnamed protein product [Callosobruchus analis]
MRRAHRLLWLSCRTAHCAAWKNKIRLLHSILLDFIPAHDRHTGRSVVKLICEVLQLYGLTNSIQGITTDNTNGNFTFVNILKTDIPGTDSKDNHFVCFAQILNLSARDFMKILDLELEEFDNTLLSQIEDDKINEVVQPQSPGKKYAMRQKN